MATVLTGENVFARQQELATQADDNYTSLVTWLTTTFVAGLVTTLVTELKPGNLSDSTIDLIVTKVANSVGKPKITPKSY